jgi:hypothetical protein
VWLLRFTSPLLCDLLSSRALPAWQPNALVTCTDVALCSSLDSVRLFVSYGQKYITNLVSREGLFKIAYWDGAVNGINLEVYV